MYSHTQAYNSRWESVLSA